MKEIVVLNETFSDFPIGPFPFDPKHSATGEYHYYPTEGYKGNWYDPIVYFNWLGPSWIITENEGIHYMEQTRHQISINENVWPTLVSGNVTWKNYVIEAMIRPLSTRSHSGIMFRYQHSRRHYFFGFEDGKVLLLKRDQEDWIEIDSAKFDYNVDHYYQLKVECVGSSISCSINGKVVLSGDDDAYTYGKIGLTSRVPAQYAEVSVKMNETEHSIWLQEQNKEQVALAQLQAEYPQPLLWKKIHLGNFGAVRQVRFGHLLGTDDLQIVFAQHQKRVHKDAYAQISCLTAINLEGEILWQVGEPSPLFDNALLTADLPFQVCDIDNDGYDEVIIAHDFKLKILDGRTGKVKKWIHTPLSEEPDHTLHSVPFEQYAFDRVNVDAIRIANFSGNETPTDIVIKDRYSRVWAFDNQLRLLWKFQGRNTGHFPYTVDLDNDGKDEMFVGYHLVDHDGTLLWTLPVETDHTDEIIIGKWDFSESDPQIAIASGDEGFMIADLEGNLLVKQMIGHAQRISVGNYRPDLEGLEFAAVTYWGSQGIVYIFDHKGEIIEQFEPTSNGNIISPVNWTGDGRDLILLNGNIEHGGLIDGHGRRVVVFPDDGHPDLCAEVLDLTGDGRDEIVLWDHEHMYIYTQDRPAFADPVKVPIKYPHYNASNYRGEYNFPKE